ncbi:MAG: butyrate kinase [Planctomycetota bacterium]|jgi:butyrate kinase
MSDTPTILVINPGSTSTRIALYDGEQLVDDEHLVCDADQLAACDHVIDQKLLRDRQVKDLLEKLGRSVADLDAVAARGGPLQPVPGGVYRVNEVMLADAADDAFTEHVSKLACLIAADLTAGTAVPCFIVDPVSTDEFEPVSRISGLKELPRISLVHALNIKRAARQVAEGMGKTPADVNLILAHLGGGISVAVSRKGRLIDAVDANGEGPFSPERSGGLRVDSLNQMVLASGDDVAAVRRRLTREGGFMSHLGTTDAREIERRVIDGDAYAQLVCQAMAYTVAKHICALAAAVDGAVDAVVLTGGLAHAKMLTDWITRRVSFLAPVHVVPGENEMIALREGVARALAGDEPIRVYPSGDIE